MSDPPGGRLDSPTDEGGRVLNGQADPDRPFGRDIIDVGGQGDCGYNVLLAAYGLKVGQTLEKLYM